MKKIPLHWQILGGLFAGLIWGVISTQYGFGKFTTDFVKPFGVIFVNLLKMIAMPMIVASLVTGIASLDDITKVSRIGGKSIGIFVLTTALAISIGLVTVNLMKPGEGLSAESRDQLISSYGSKAGEKEKTAEEFIKKGPLQPLIDLFPENLTKAATDNTQMLQIVIVALIFGIALVMVPGGKGKPVKEFIESLNEVILKIVDIIMIMAPVGVFALIASVISDMAGSDPSKVLELLNLLGLYSITVIIGLALHVFLVYMPLVKIFSKLNPFTFLKKMRPVQLLAFSTSSSNATLPLNIENAKEKIGVSEEVSGFVLPLGATVNMDGTSLYQSIATVFIAQAFGMNLTFADQLTIILTATLASVGSAGVPGAGMVMLVIVLNSVGVPVQGIALIMGVDRILDMCRTVVNVTGDASVAVVVASTENQMRVVG